MTKRILCCCIFHTVLLRLPWSHPSMGAGLLMPEHRGERIHHGAALHLVRSSSTIHHGKYREREHQKTKKSGSRATQRTHVYMDPATRTPGKSPAMRRGVARSGTFVPPNAPLENSSPLHVSSQVLEKEAGRAISRASAPACRGWRV